jgi:hypothetical protein
MFSILCKHGANSIEPHWRHVVRAFSGACLCGAMGCGSIQGASTSEQSGARQSEQAASDEACSTAYRPDRQSFACDAEASEQPRLLRAGHGSLSDDPIWSAGDYVLFRELVSTELDPPFSRRLSRVRMDGTGYEVIFDDEQENRTLNQVFADEQDYYVFTDFGTLLRRSPNGGEWQQIFEQRSQPLAMDAKAIYVVSSTVPARIIAISRADGWANDVVPLPPEIQIQSAVVRDQVMFFTTRNESDLYSIGLSAPQPQLEKLGPGCQDFALVRDSILCGRRRVTEINLDTRQSSVLLDPRVIDPAWSAAHDAEVSLSLTQTDGSDVYVYATKPAADLPVWRLDLNDPRPHTFLCNRSAIRALTRTGGQIVWREERSGNHECMYSAVR